MRGTLPSIGHVDWPKPEPPPLPVLPIEASRQLYVHIDPAAVSDEALEALLSELDHMPLAVTLMAKVGSEGGGTPTALLKRRGLRRTEAIHNERGDRLTSVDLSIQVSIESNLTRKNPEALRVLSVLAMLPGGIRTETIKDLVPDIEDPVRATSVLLRASLAYTKVETNSIHLLSPIRAYVAHHHHPALKLWQGLHNFCFGYLKRYDSDPFDRESFITALAIEGANLDAILTHALRHDPSQLAITTAMGFIYYQSLTYARTAPHIPILAVAAVKRVGTERQVADYLRRVDIAQSETGQHKDAIGALDEARKTFLRLGNANLAATCLQHFGQTARLQGRYDDARSALERSRDEFSRLGNVQGSINCIEALAHVSISQGWYKNAQSDYEEAVVRCQSIGGGRGHALRGLGLVACIEGRYEDAQTMFKQSHAETTQLGDLQGSAYSLFYSGVVYVMQELYGSAQIALVEAQEVFVRLRNSTGVAKCLEWLGNTDWMEGRIHEGRRKLGQALAIFLQLGQNGDIAECTQHLGDANAADGLYEEAQIQLQDALGTFRRLNMPRNVADRVSVIGEILVKQGHLEEARSDLEAAGTAYEEMGVRGWWHVRCCKNLVLTRG
ncbi:hypothetical protein FRB95_003751 [Tulasnella sp. JGI-2019a]|nr:hypothetical protein FRB95_003751 [Tulasnella sp. JGI-2019a]